MNIVPKLNLNKHPRDVDDYSLVDATNMIIDCASPILKTENSLYSMDCYFTITDINGEETTMGPYTIDVGIAMLIYQITEITSYTNNIRYILPCNDELVIFVENITSETIDNFYIFRYYEKTKHLKLITNNFEYNGGNLIGAFTYNQNNLIIAISEYFEDNSKKIPLKVIDLGNFDEGVLKDNKEQLDNNNLHSIVSEVKIPNIKTKYNYNSAYKGWYYIFIRYKHSTDNYTQWYNTNACVYIDTYRDTTIIKTFISSEYDLGSATRNYSTSVKLSDSIDIANISFDCIIDNIDTRYSHYQLGFICISKTYTKCFKTIDINKDNLFFTFANTDVEEYSINDLITTYFNYYNSKTLTNVNNVLYIGNYLESDNESSINTKNLNITFRSKWNAIGEINETLTTNHISLNILMDYYNVKNIENTFTITAKTLKDGTLYYDATKMPKLVGGNNRYGIRLMDIKEDDTITVEYRNPVNTSRVTKTVKAKKFIFVPYYFNKITGMPDTPGHYYFLDDNDDIITNGIETINTTLYNETKDFESNEDYNIYITVDGRKHPIVASYGFYTKYTVNIDIEEQTAINNFNNLGAMPNSYYNFFIHFIDKYGISTKGILINSNNFNTINCYNLDQNELILTLETLEDKRELFKVSNVVSPNYHSNITVEIDSIPDGYIGWYISHEKFEKTILYKGIGFVDNTNKHKIDFYSDELNFEDSLNLNFDSLIAYNTDGDFSTVIKPNDSYTSDTVKIVSKKLYVADSYDNILKSTRLSLLIDDDFTSSNSFRLHLLKTDISDLYKKQIKTLIPCSTINYDINKQYNLSINTAFISTGHALVAGELFYNSALKIYQSQEDSTPKSTPYQNYLFDDYFTVPFESLQLNNAPVTTFFPDKGINDSSTESNKTFVIGHIVEVKNTIDLYQQKQVSVDELYPKSLEWYNPDIYFTNKFNKTIRRSNIIQDESLSIGWRKFEIEQYKNITENKGSIIKLVSIGLYFLVHTEHSLFLFNSTDTLKSVNGNIQLNDTDIWDIKYKEVLTSTLGYGGIQKEHHGIVGAFGYIFYDSDSGCLYRYDNNDLKQIDKDIQNFIYKNKDRFTDIKFADDKERYRLIISFSTEITDKDTTISYSYLYNSFISRHTYYFDKAFSTKNKLYMMTKQTVDGNTYPVGIVMFNNTGYGHYNAASSLAGSLCPMGSDSEVSIIINTHYEIIKFLEYIKFKINEVKVVNNYFPVEGRTLHYASDGIIIQSEFCDTGLIDSTVDAETVNDVTNYKKPYWRFGNWHLNMIRNKMDEYSNGTITSDDASRVYGNWFVITFKFNKGYQKEIETLECKFSLDKN